VTKLGRRTLLWMIPLNVLLAAWVWIGRMVFGVYGWYALLLAPVVVVLLLAFVVTTVLALTQPGRPLALTRPQAVAQLVTWLGAFVFGAVLPDFGDTDDSHISLLTQLFGRTDAMLGLSYAIATAAAAVTVVAWMVLLVALTAGRRKDGAPEPQPTAATLPDPAGR
jgi:hypothetical protein